jgi:hypothetical protein
MTSLLSIFVVRGSRRFAPGTEEWIYVEREVDIRLAR